MSNYEWIDNPTENGVAVCDTDVLNECLMHLKYNNQKIKSATYSFNSGNVNSSGNSEIFDFDAPTEVNLNIDGTYTINIQTSGYYSVKLVGGGGGGRNGYNSPNAYGGSGAAFVGEVYLNTGSHNIVVGGYNNNGDGADSILYDENGNVLITAGGGKYATSAGAFLPAYDGAGGTLTIASGVQTQNVTVQSNGGTGASGSKYNGYGQGGYSTTQEGRTDGYFSIVLPSASSNISYKVGGSYPALTGTLADGKQFTLNGLNSDDITGLADGSYIKYVGSDGSSELVKANLTVAKTIPLNPNNNDVWINNSVIPLSVKKYTTSTPNYTVTGTPTISSEGIASGFSASNYITIPNLDLTNAQSFKLAGKFNSDTSVNPSYAGRIFNFYNQSPEINALDIRFNANSNTTLKLHYATDSSSGSTNSSDITVTNNEWHDYTIEHTGTRLIFSVDNVAVVDVASQISYFQRIFRVAIGNGYPISSNNFFAGSIDLKEFKIYVNNNLVYQPNIQNGWQDYDKVPLGKITLSSGGITGVKTFPYNIDYVGNNIIETYQNGADWYRVYADGFCIQGSSETISSSYSQTNKTRNLLKAFKDTNYTVLVTPNTTITSDFALQYISVKEKAADTFTTTYDTSCSWVAYGYVN